LSEYEDRRTFDPVRTMLAGGEIPFFPYIAWVLRSDGNCVAIIGGIFWREKVRWKGLRANVYCR